MELNNENREFAQKVNDFLRANRKIILGVLGGIFLVGIVTVVVLKVKEKSRVDGISNVEKVIYELQEFKNKQKAKKTSESEEKKDETSEDVPIDEEIVAKEDEAINQLTDLTKEVSGYAYFRANTAIAEIYFQRKDYEKALNFYELASKISEKSYVAGIAYFNAAASADELGNKEKALEFYQKASRITEFPLVTRAMFNVGRIYESLNKKEDAIKMYNNLLEKYPKNEWALLAKSRIIILENN